MWITGTPKYNSEAFPVVADTQIVLNTRLRSWPHRRCARARSRSSWWLGYTKDTETHADVGAAMSPDRVRHLAEAQDWAP